MSIHSLSKVVKYKLCVLLLCKMRCSAKVFGQLFRKQQISEGRLSDLSVSHLGIEQFGNYIQQSCFSSMGAFIGPLMLVVIKAVFEKNFNCKTMIVSKTSETNSRLVVGLYLKKPWTSIFLRPAKLNFVCVSWENYHFSRVH